MINSISSKHFLNMLQGKRFGYSIKYMLINMLGTDGNFAIDSNSDGLADGFTISSTLSAKSMANNIQSFTPSAQYGAINIIPKALTMGDKVYICCYVKSNTSQTNMRAAGAFAGVNTVHTGSGNFEFLSYLGQKTIEANLSVKVQSELIANWAEIQVKQFYVINLTQIFGAGQEPSKAEIDAFMQIAITQGYFVNRDYVRV